MRLLCDFMDLNVRVTGRHGEWFAVKAISEELVERTFAPLKTCDDPVVAMATGDTMAGSEAVDIVMRTRKDAADILARELSLVIVSAMKKDDTHNGYSNDT